MSAWIVKNNALREAAGSRYMKYYDSRMRTPFYSPQNDFTVSEFTDSIICETSSCNSPVSGETDNEASIYIHKYHNPDNQPGVAASAYIRAQFRSAAIGAIHMADRCSSVECEDNCASPYYVTDLQQPELDPDTRRAQRTVSRILSITDPMYVYSSHKSTLSGRSALVGDSFRDVKLGDDARFVRLHGTRLFVPSINICQPLCVVNKVYKDTVSHYILYMVGPDSESLIRRDTGASSSELYSKHTDLAQNLFVQVSEASAPGLKSNTSVMPSTMARFSSDVKTNPLERMVKELGGEFYQTFVPRTKEVVTSFNLQETEWKVEHIGNPRHLALVLAKVDEDDLVKLLQVFRDYKGVELEKHTIDTSVYPTESIVIDAETIDKTTPLVTTSGFMTTFVPPSHGKNSDSVLFKTTLMSTRLCFDGNFDHKVYTAMKFSGLVLPTGENMMYDDFEDQCIKNYFDSHKSLDTLSVCPTLVHINARASNCARIVEEIATIPIAMKLWGIKDFPQKASEYFLKLPELYRILPGMFANKDCFSADFNIHKYQMLLGEIRKLNAKELDAITFDSPPRTESATVITPRKPSKVKKYKRPKVTGAAIRKMPVTQEKSTPKQHSRRTYKHPEGVPFEWDQDEPLTQAFIKGEEHVDTEDDDDDDDEDIEEFIRKHKN